MEFLTCLEPVLAGFLALAMFVMLMDNLVCSARAKPGYLVEANGQAEAPGRA